MSLSKPYCIGVTGTFGAGKSTVGNILKKIKIFVVDTDKIVEDILSTSNHVTKKIVQAFGKNVLSSVRGKYINKKTLGNIVFKNPRARKTLELLIHPEVQKQLITLFRLNKNKPIIVVLIPLLFESKQESLYDEIWCVTCTSKKLLKRLRDKGYLLKDAQNRVKAQLPQKEKARRADFVINNSGSLQETKNQVKKRIRLLARLIHNRHLFFDK